MVVDGVDDVVDESFVTAGVDAAALGAGSGPPGLTVIDKTACP